MANNNKNLCIHGPYKVMLLLPLPHCCCVRFAYPNYEVAIGMNEAYDPKMTLMSGIQIKKDGRAGKM